MRESWKWVRWVLIAVIVIGVLYAFISPYTTEASETLFMDWLETATVWDVLFWGYLVVWLGSPSSSSCNYKRKY